jgi:hypothetical protein
VAGDTTARDGEEDDRKHEIAGTAKGNCAKGWPLMIRTLVAKMTCTVWCASRGKRILQGTNGDGRWDITESMHHEDGDALSESAMAPGYRLKHSNVHGRSGRKKGQRAEA